MKKSFLGTTFLALLAAASLAGCSSSSNETTAETAAETAEESTAEAKEADGDLEKLVVGASPAPHAEILEAARDLLADKGYDLEIVEYSRTTHWSPAIWMQTTSSTNHISIPLMRRMALIW